jgi:hypothetical protein
MPSLVDAADDTVVVESGVFGLQDVDTLSCPVPWPQDLLPPGEGLLVRPNRVDFDCGISDLRVPVRLEAWTGEPPADASGDDEDVDLEETEVDLSSGTVRLWELTGGGSLVTFTVGPPGHYGLRSISTGHRETAERMATGERVPDGTVRYLLRFWPKPG